MLIEQLFRTSLVGIIILAEHQRAQVTVLIDNRKRVDLVVPDDIVAFLQRHAGICRYTLRCGSHKLAHLKVTIISRNPVITAGYNTAEFTKGLSILGNRHGGVAGSITYIQHILKRHCRRKGGVRNNKASLVRLNLTYHGGLILGGLRAINKRNAALLC